MPLPGSLHPIPALPKHLASPARQASSASVTVLGMPLFGIQGACRQIQLETYLRAEGPELGIKHEKKGIVEGIVDRKCFGTVLEAEVKSD